MAEGLGLMYNNRMNRWFGILTLFVCIFLDVGPYAYAQAGPTIFVCPFEGSDGPLESRNAMAMTLAVYDSMGDAPQLIGFPSVRQCFEEMGMPLSASKSLATRMTLARRLGARLILFGRLGETQVSVSIQDLDTSHILRRTFEKPQGDASFCLLGQEISKLLGYGDPIGTLPSDEFYRVLASTYSTMPKDIAGNVLRKLLEHHRTSFFLFSEFRDRFVGPACEELDQAKLVFWRDIYCEHGVFRDALEYSSTLLSQNRDGDTYGIHAVILFQAGNKDMACRYLKMALAYGATASELEDLGISCGIDLAFDDRKSIGPGSLSVQGK